ncbi:hypothetical protein TI39_contig423g00004 [Zymoseptoria brevis]|uniref:C2H2-type domain-containing protein n=1 Tax=Zymoseptoria brevis TaxID=1047168 RepID=A0A0F4GLI4_9PEZI|nr:hypothetical protein TI39_contig423g00004 [Zymoseptoria brevis]
MPASEIDLAPSSSQQPATTIPETPDATELTRFERPQRSISMPASQNDSAPPSSSQQPATTVLEPQDAAELMRFEREVTSIEDAPVEETPLPPLAQPSLSNYGSSSRYNPGPPQIRPYQALGGRGLETSLVAADTGTRSQSNSATPDAVVQSTERLTPVPVAPTRQLSTRQTVSEDPQGGLGSEQERMVSSPGGGYRTTNELVEVPREESLPESEELNEEPPSSVADEPAEYDETDLATLFPEHSPQCGPLIADLIFFNGVLAMQFVRQLNCADGDIWVLAVLHGQPGLGPIVGEDLIREFAGYGIILRSGPATPDPWFDEFVKAGWYGWEGSEFEAWAWDGPNATQDDQGNCTAATVDQAGPSTAARATSVLTDFGDLFANDPVMLGIGIDPSGAGEDAAQADVAEPETLQGVIASGQDNKNMDQNDNDTAIDLAIDLAGREAAVESSSQGLANPGRLCFSATGPEFIYANDDETIAAPAPDRTVVPSGNDERNIEETGIDPRQTVINSPPPPPPRTRLQRDSTGQIGPRNERMIGSIGAEAHIERHLSQADMQYAPNESFMRSSSTTETSAQPNQPAFQRPRSSLPSGSTKTQTRDSVIGLITSTAASTGGEGSVADDASEAIAMNTRSKKKKGKRVSSPSAETQGAPSKQRKRGPKPKDRTKPADGTNQGQWVERVELTLIPHDLGQDVVQQIHKNWLDRKLYPKPKQKQRSDKKLPASKHTTDDPPTDILEWSNIIAQWGDPWLTDTETLTRAKLGKFGFGLIELFINTARASACETTGEYSDQAPTTPAILSQLWVRAHVAYIQNFTHGTDIFSDQGRLRAVHTIEALVLHMLLNRCNVTITQEVDDRIRDMTPHALSFDVPRIGHDGLGACCVHPADGQRPPSPWLSLSVLLGEEQMNVFPPAVRSDSTSPRPLDHRDSAPSTVIATPPSPLPDTTAMDCRYSEQAGITQPPSSKSSFGRYSESANKLVVFPERVGFSLRTPDPLDSSQSIEADTESCADGVDINPPTCSSYGSASISPENPDIAIISDSLPADIGPIECFCNYVESDGWNLRCYLCSRRAHQSCYDPNVDETGLPHTKLHYCVRCVPKRVDLLGAKARQREKREKREERSRRLLAAFAANALQCSKCGKFFNRMDALKRHFRQVHRTELSFPCVFDGCPESFARRDAAARHMATHDSMGYMTCIGCRGKFRPDDYLREHLQGRCRGTCNTKIMAELDGSNPQPISSQRVARDATEVFANETSRLASESPQWGMQATGVESQRGPEADDGSTIFWAERAAGAGSQTYDPTPAEAGHLTGFQGNAFEPDFSAQDENTLSAAVVESGRLSETGTADFTKSVTNPSSSNASQLLPALSQNMGTPQQWASSLDGQTPTGILAGVQQNTVTPHERSSTLTDQTHSANTSGQQQGLYVPHYVPQSMAQFWRWNPTPAEEMRPAQSTDVPQEAQSSQQQRRDQSGA